MSARFCRKISLSLHWFRRKPRGLWSESELRWDRPGHTLISFHSLYKIFSMPTSSLLSPVLLFEIFLPDTQLLIQAQFHIRKYTDSKVYITEDYFSNAKGKAFLMKTEKLQMNAASIKNAFTAYTFCPWDFLLFPHLHSWLLN